MSNPWFRLHADMLSDEKIMSLGFSDRWFFVAVMCLKSDGMLEKYEGSKLDRKVALRLGITTSEADELKARLIEEALVDDAWQPCAWAKRQYKSDTSAERVRAHRAKKKPQSNQQDNGVKRYSNVTVTPPDTDTDTDTEKKDKSIVLFSEDFETWWKDEYPARKGTHSKAKARQRYIKHRKAGVTREQISKATDEYFQELVEADRLGTEFVKHATTFLNDELWRND